MINKMLLLFKKPDSEDGERPLNGPGFSHDKLDEAHKIQDEGLRYATTREILDKDQLSFYEAKRYLGAFRRSRERYKKYLEDLPNSERVDMMDKKKNN